MKTVFPIKAASMLWLILFAVICIASTASASSIAEVSILPLGTSATIDTAVILSTIDLTPDSSLRSFQVRDNTRALTIYGSNAEIAAALTGFAAGDLIEISGQTAKRDGNVVLITGTVGGFAVSGRTSTAPLLTNALNVSPSDIAEPYESNLVCLHNVSFVDSGTFAVGSDYALLGGNATIRISTNDLNLAGYAIPTGLLNISGIVISTDSGYRLAPRGFSDIVSVPEPSSIIAVAAGLVSLLGIGRRRA